MTYQQNMINTSADWLTDAVRSKPEALLLVAAGCALLMRTGRRTDSSVARRMSMSDHRTGPAAREDAGRPRSRRSALAVSAVARENLL